MDEWTEIRRKVLVEGAAKRAICREYDLHFRTLQKILDHAEPPGYSGANRRVKFNLGPFLDVITQIIEADRDAPRKQCHTARRIFERLRDEYGYTGAITQVREAVAEARKRSKEVFVPLSHPLGNAQFDFGEATVEIAGTRVKVALAVMTLVYCDAYFVQAYPRECTETFQAGHLAAFDFFGGVLRKIDYDNTTIAVKKVLQGSKRELTREFLRLMSHFLFAHHFCAVRRGNEKGHVENHVGYARRNLLVPVPAFDSFVQLNAYLAAACYADLFRRVRAKPETKAALLAVDQAAMLPIPKNTFECRRIEHACANSLSLVRFDRNDYSVPTEIAHHDVLAIGTIDEVRIVAGTRLVARPARHWGKEEVFFNPVHYLALLEKKPGALDFARPLEGWKLPGCFVLLRRRLEADLGSAGTREFIKVLRLLENASLTELARAGREAIRIGATGCDAIACILHHHNETPVGLFALDGHPHLASVALLPPDLSAYRCLTTAV